MSEDLIIKAGGKSIACILTTPAKSTSSACFVLGHGASGDSSTGNLPEIADSLASAGIPVLRYNASGQLPGRVKTLEVMIIEIGAPSHGPAPLSFTVVK